MEPTCPFMSNRPEITYADLKWFSTTVLPIYRNDYSLPGPHEGSISHSLLRLTLNHLQEPFDSFSY